MFKPGIEPRPMNCTSDS